jgi:hypothetical protein
MLIPSAMFANHASADGGLLAIQGAGWEWVNLRSFPGTVHGFVAGLIELDPGHEPTAIEASVTGPDDQTQVFGAQVIEDPSEGNSGARIPLVVPMTFVARQPGLYVINITDAEGPLTSLELDVRPMVTQDLI